jgi:hypothetical protein
MAMPRIVGFVDKRHSTENLPELADQANRMPVTPFMSRRIVHLGLGHQLGESFAGKPV